VDPAEWTPFQTHFFSENLVAPRIEPGTSGSVARNSDHYTTETVMYIYIYHIEYNFLIFSFQTESLVKVSTSQVHRLLPHIPQKFYRLGQSQKPGQLLAMVKTDVAKKHPVIIFR
jgi:hypothetical protein